MDLYERIRDIAKSKGISINKMENDLDFARSYISKFRKITPSGDVLRKIAEYLDVSVDLLLGKELSPKDEKDIAKKLSSTLDQLEGGDGLMFEGEALDDETKELLKISLENAIRTAKITAKKKYTPKKYRKDN